MEEMTPKVIGQDIGEFCKEMHLRVEEDGDPIIALVNDVRIIMFREKRFCDPHYDGIRDGTIEFTVERVIQYKPWRFGNVNPGFGQMGIYELKASNGKTYFALIKDYIAFEGDWRIMLVIITNTEMEMKGELQVNELGFIFMDYLFPM